MPNPVPGVHIEWRKPKIDVLNLPLVANWTSRFRRSYKYVFVPPILRALWSMGVHNSTKHSFPHFGLISIHLHVCYHCLISYTFIVPLSFQRSFWRDEDAWKKRCEHCLRSSYILRRTVPCGDVSSYCIQRPGACTLGGFTGSRLWIDKAASCWWERAWTGCFYSVNVPEQNNTHPTYWVLKLHFQ